MKSLLDKWSLFDYINAVFLFFVAFVAIFPMWYVFVISVSTADTYLIDNLHFWPKAISFAEYRRAILAGDIVNSLKVSIIVTISGTLLSMALTIPCAYALSKKRLRGRKVFLGIILITMFLNGGMIPRYLLVVGLGLRNSLPALVLPIAVSAYYLVISKNYMGSISQSLEDSAKIDGCNDLKILARIVVPISKPMIAAISLFYGVQYYNDYFNALLFISSRSKYPLQFILREMVVNNIANTSSVGGDSTLTTEILKMACVIIGMVPILVVYPFLQKYFVRGLMLGAVKE